MTNKDKIRDVIDYIRAHIHSEEGISLFFIAVDEEDEEAGTGCDIVHFFTNIERESVLPFFTHHINNHPNKVQEDKDGNEVIKH